MEGALVPGRILRGKYEVIKILGSGGMGIVVLARHLRLDQHVAIKMLQRMSSSEDDPTTARIVAERFAREARAASKLRGAHAVRILDVDDSESGDPFLVMEYLAGSDFQHLIAEHGPLAIEAAIAYMLQACEGVAEAHAVGIVHRDLKPANLFLTTKPDGSPLVKLLDFGISKMAAPTTTLSPEAASITRPDDAAIGSPAYMSPEQIKSSANVDQRTDIWALGVVLFHFLTGALPFEATTTAALAARIASDRPLSVRDKRPDADTPAELVAIVERCLAKDPADRFQNVAELAAALAAVNPELDHAESAARIARVVATTTGNLRAPGAEQTSAETSAARAAVPPDATAPKTPIATASVRDVVPAPRLEDQLVVTEYASTRKPSEAPAHPNRGGRIVAIAGALSGIAVLATVLLTKRGTGTQPALPASSVVPVLATSGAPLPSSSLAASTTSSATLPSPTTTPPPPPTKLPARRPTPSSAPRNPMDLDFR